MPLPEFLKTIMRFRLPSFKESRPEPLDNQPNLYSTVIPELLQNAGWRLTPSRLVEIIQEADGGDPRAQTALFATMQEKEPLVAAHFQTRKLAVLACDWDVRSKSHADAAEDIKKELQAADVKGAIHHILNSVVDGYSAVAVDWLPGGQKVKGFVPIMPDAFIFDEAGFPALVGVDGSEIPLASYHPAQVLYAQAEGKAGLPCRKGLGRTLLWMYLFKNGGFRDWSVFLERFGMPFLLGKIPSGDYRDAKLRGELMQQLMAVRSGGSGVGTTETEMQMLNGASSGSQTAYLDFCKYCDDVMTLAILGQLGTSAKSTGFSNGGAQAQVRQDILDADCALVSGVINKSLIPWMCAVRNLPADADVEFVIDSEEPEDLERRARRDLALTQATGCRLTKEYAEKTYGVELDDAATAPANPANPANPQQQQRQEFNDRQFATVERADRIVKAAIVKLAGEGAFEAFRKPVEDAISKFFGDLDADADDLVEQFSERVPQFLESLPSALADMDAPAFRKALEESMLAAFVDGLMPASYWRSNANG